MAKIRRKNLYRALKTILQDTLIHEKIACNIHGSKGPP